MSDPIKNEAILILFFFKTECSHNLPSAETKNAPRDRYQKLSNFLIKNGNKNGKTKS